MGPRELILAGSVAIDSNILIYSIERHPAYVDVLTELWDAFDREEIPLHASELCLLECLVSPIRSGKKELIARFESFLASPSLVVVPISSSILRRAAALRAGNARLRTPDAIHLATAMTTGCGVFLTNDRRMPAIEGIQIVPLSDLSPAS